MKHTRRPWLGSALALALLALAVSTGCKPKDKDPGAGLVVDASVTSAPVEAGPAAVADVTQCPGCQLTPVQSWEFAGVYQDSACTEPLAQIAQPACAPVAALGEVPITYVDEVGARKAGATATVTLTAQVAAAARYRKSGKACVKANEVAVDVTPIACVGQRVCRDATGALACAGCRTFANGCPDFEETRMYATIDDPELSGAKKGKGGNANLARLRQCCAALAAEARRLGASPEAGVLMSASVQCNALVAAAGPSGTAPELGALRSMLAGRRVPAVCSGL